jgi:hypothetical protein
MRGYRRDGGINRLWKGNEGVGVVVKSWVRVAVGDTAARYILSRKEIKLRDITDMEIHPAQHMQMTSVHVNVD